MTSECSRGRSVRKKKVYSRTIFSELEKIGIVAKQAQKLLKDLEPYGVGKVTGAGGQAEGSGLILFLVKDKPGLENYTKKNKLILLPFEQDFEGSRVN